jgi:hypothetical protein
MTLSNNDPWKQEPDPADAVSGGVRISLSLKTGTGYESGLINVSGTESEVAEFLKLDQDSDAYRASPFAVITKTWNAGHAWAMKNYTEVTGKGKA